MKNIIVLCMLFATTMASAQTDERNRIKGAIIGGVIGHQIDHDVGAPVGAMIGYLWNTDTHDYNKEFRKHCKRNVPGEFYDVKDAWIEGCVRRLEREKAERERRAYQDGYQMPEYQRQ